MGTSSIRGPGGIGPDGAALRLVVSNTAASGPLRHVRGRPVPSSTASRAGFIRLAATENPFKDEEVERMLRHLESGRLRLEALLETWLGDYVHDDVEVFVFSAREPVLRQALCRVAGRFRDLRIGQMRDRFGPEKIRHMIRDDLMGLIRAVVFIDLVLGELSPSKPLHPVRAEEILAEVFRAIEEMEDQAPGDDTGAVSSGEMMRSAREVVQGDLFW